MRNARFTEHQIIAALKSVEAGRTVKDVCREAGISEASYYNWKAKLGGMEAKCVELKRVRLHLISGVKRGVHIDFSWAQTIGQNRLPGQGQSNSSLIHIQVRT